MKHLQNNQAGIAHVVVLVAVVVVVGVIGFAGWRVMQNNKDNGSGGSAANSSTAKQVAKECTKEMNDKDLCKFFTSWDGTKKFAAVSTNTSEGKTTKSTIRMDGGNTYMKVEGDFSMEVITIGTATYTKGGSYWWKQTTKPSTGASSTPTVDADDYKFEEPSDTPNVPKTQYKNLGKEACGNLKCFKYQIIDPADTTTSAQYIWFDDSQYLIRKMRNESKDGTINQQEFSYDNISVAVPSPVKELAPNQYIMPGESEPTTIPTLDGLTQ